MISVKKTPFSFENNILCLDTECGEFKFQISEETGQDVAERIANVMTGEMEKADQAFGEALSKSNPYAKLLLANLNLSDRYVRLENKYEELVKAHELALSRCQGGGRNACKTEPAATLDPADASDNSLPPGTSASSQLPEPEKVTETACQTTEGDRSDSATKAVEDTVPEDDPEKNTGATVETVVHEDDAALPAVESEKKSQAPSRDKGAGRPGRLVIQVLDTLKKNRAAETTSTSGQTQIPAAQDTGGFCLPSLDFLEEGGREQVVDQEAIRRDAELLEQKLGYFGIKGEVMEVLPGPVITTFEYKPAPGIKISKIVNLADDLALALSALSIRLVAPIPGKDVIGVEIPNPSMSIVPFRDVVGSDAFSDIKSPAPICLGKDIIGRPVVVGLEKMPHLLIAGATGTGKSVALNAMIASILYKSTPDRVKFIMIDPKRIELSLFNDIPHLITPVITDMKKANIALQWVVREMELRYEKLAELRVRNIEQYNKKIRAKEFSDTDEYPHFPYIVVIIDELADLMMTAGKDIEYSLTRIAQMARAAGIHLILATQRPSVDVLTGIIKANFPTRISFQVSSKTDSRTIIDANGAETLLGRGDMLFVPPGTARLKRVHGTYLSEKELATITDFIKAQGAPEYVADVTTEPEDPPGDQVEISDDEYDEKYQQALDFVISTRQASISGVQRALRIGYNRAARIIDLMEKQGIVASSDGVRPRQVIGRPD